MAKQLIFASVPQGLQPGRSGYCLVAGHTDLPQTLIKQLEQETSVFPDQNDSQTTRHEVRKVGDSNWHVFTRQSLGIKDYTGRLSGITHVIAEKADTYPEKVLPESVMSRFTGWVNVPPEIPKSFGENEEIDLQTIAETNAGFTGISRKQSKIEAPVEDQEVRFRLNKAARSDKPAPRPRSGIYYEARKKTNTNKWWIGLGVVLFIYILIMVF